MVETFNGNLDTILKRQENVRKFFLTTATRCINYKQAATMCIRYKQARSELYNIDKDK